GMGYGTTMTPVLMLFGFTPLQIVPAVLLSELVTGLLSGALHHREGNVNFHFKVLNFQRIKDSLKLPDSVAPDVHTYGIQVSAHLKVVLLLLSATILGASSAVYTARILSKQWTSLYISIMVIAMGVLILVCFNRQFKYSWKRIVGLGLLASFNKGLTGGGYGPLVVSGQMLSGVAGKNAIGITSMAEGITCALGVLIYMLTSKGVTDWRLAPIIIAGAVCSVPLSVKSVKIMNPRLLKVLIAILTIILGFGTLLKTLKSF
ncbi:MAG: sulfite exporter TauE/SafE family protein, partial [Candidatus Omnitrophica bacterium]|nr:sulfite exporter TauE/SafE family protein [Candidatus Omnitrophota bacterium]